MQSPYLTELASKTFFDLNDPLAAAHYLNKAQALLRAISPEKIQRMIQQSLYPNSPYMIEKIIRLQLKSIQGIREQIAQHDQKFVDRFSQ